MYPFIDETVITDLGFGGGFALWGFRAIAAGQPSGCTISSGFNRAFAIDNAERKSQHGGTHGRIAINALKSFCNQVSTIGRRKILISDPGSMGLTADEIGIVAALAAGQSKDEDRAHAHLTWLLGHSDTALAYTAAVTYGMICHQSQIEIDAPVTRLMACLDSRPAPQTGLRVGARLTRENASPAPAMHFRPS